MNNSSHYCENCGRCRTCHSDPEQRKPKRHTITLGDLVGLVLIGGFVGALFIAEVTKPSPARGLH